MAGEEGSYRNYGNVNLITTLDDNRMISNDLNQVNIFYNRPGGAQVFPGFQPNNELTRSRGNLGLHFDTELDFSPGTFLAAAVRFEDYTDFGTTFNWKIAGRLKVTKDMAIRGAISTGFRAPSLQQRYFNSVSTRFEIDPETGIDMPNEIGTFRNDSRIAKLFNIPDLTNESSFNISAGAIWAIRKNLNLTVDGYMISIDDRVILTNSFSSSNSEEISNILK